MKSIIFTLFSLLIISTNYIAKADACDSLDVIYFGFNPFNSTELVVYVHNTNTVEFFSYPGFKLVDTKGDTVATETVNFFGISEYSAHRLVTTLANYEPGEVFNGTLLLYTGFYDSLVCAFSVSEVLIPASGCTDFTVYSSDYNGTIEQPINWEVSDALGNTVFSGIHDYALDTFYYNSPVCLENGCYQLTLTAANPLEGIVQAGINFLAFNIDTYLQMEAGETSASFTFGVYECDSVNSVAENKGIDFELFPNPASDILTVEMAHTGDVTVAVYSISGQLLSLKTRQEGNRLQTNISELTPGVYIMELSTRTGVERARFIRANE
ncbi:MAG: T9SS type A sorting domain-containing protein [Bacteroidia bacterium]